MSFIGRDGLLRKVAGLQALVRNDGGHQDPVQGAPVHAYLPPDRPGFWPARGVVPAPPTSHWPPAAASASSRAGSHRGCVMPGRVA